MRLGRCLNLISVIAVLFAAGVNAQNPVAVPFGRSATIDGKIEAAEWTDAATLDLTNGGKLFLKYDGRFLYLAMRGTKAGWSHLYLNAGSSSDISVIHASAALGRSIYKKDAKGLWQPSNRFVWEVRDRTISPETTTVMEAYLKKNGWVASNNNMGNASEVEYKFSPLSGQPMRIASVFMSDGGAAQYYPAGITDDVLNQKLISGTTPPDLQFDTAKWTTLELPSSKTATAANGYWKGTVTRDGKKWNVDLNVQGSSAKVDFIDLDVSDVAFPFYSFDGQHVRLEKPQPSGNPIVFDGVIKGRSFSGNWKGFGVDGLFTFSKASPKMTRYREEEVSFTNGAVKLSGTLLLPDAKTKCPAVILVHGSSPNERNAYRSWAKHFAESGIAALIYDKRGAGKSTGNTREASMEDLADDAIAGIRMLKLRRQIDAGKVGIAGHSQGGWIAPLAAARSGDVAFVITSAAAAVTPAEQSIYHRAGVMRRSGITEAEIAEATRLREKLYLLNRKILANDPDVVELRTSISRELTANKEFRWFGPSELPPELSGEMPPRGALELLFFDASTAWSRVKVPVLAVWGDQDTVVPVEKSRDLIRTLLGESGNKDVTIKIMPGVDHGNNVVSTGNGWDFPRSAPGYDETMVEWLLSRFA